MVFQILLGAWPFKLSNLVLDCNHTPSTFCPKLVRCIFKWRLLIFFEFELASLGITSGLLIIQAPEVSFKKWRHTRPLKWLEETRYTLMYMLIPWFTCLSREGEKRRLLLNIFFFKIPSLHAQVHTFIMYRGRHHLKYTPTTHKD